MDTQLNEPSQKKTERPANRKNEAEYLEKESKHKSHYIETSQNQRSTNCEILAIVLSWIAAILLFPLSILFCFIAVPEYQRAIFFRLGRVRKGALGPGLIWYLPCIDSYEIVDLRTRVEVIPTQDMLTKDSVTISVDGVLFYYITGSLHATIQISNVYESTIFIAQTTLRNVVGGKTLHELLTCREELSQEIADSVDRATAKWGVRIERVALKDINLPEILHRTMASEAEALREARAKIISAEGELMASEALREASDVMAQNKITLQLRHLQVLTSISHERRLKIYYPFPLEMLTGFGAMQSSSNKNDKKDTGNEKDNGKGHGKDKKKDLERDEDKSNDNNTDKYKIQLLDSLESPAATTTSIYKDFHDENPPSDAQEAGNEREHASSKATQKGELRSKCAAQLASKSSNNDRNV